MKKVLAAVMTLFVGLLWSTTLNAQMQMPSAEEMAKRETDQMKTELKLNADQLTKVEAINLKYAKLMSEMFSQGPGGDFAEMQKKMQENQTKKRTELEKVLNADQLKRYDEMQAERANRQGPPPM